MATQEELEAAVQAANDPAIARPEYQAVKQARKAVDDARTALENCEDAHSEAYREWAATPEYRAFIAAVRARSDWQAANWTGFMVARGIMQTPREREAS